VARIDRSIEIGAPPADVWAELERLEDHVEWMADAASLTFTTAHTRGIGVAFDCLTKVGPFTLVDAMTVTEWEPGRALAVRHVGIVTGTGRFSIEPVGADRSRLTWSEDLRTPWWMGGRPGWAVAGRVMAHIWSGNLRRLAARIEP
jgi:carbon monoxide dehydrogenase subunit G